MPLDLTNIGLGNGLVPKLVSLATSHYLSQCWPSSMKPYDINRPQWVNPTGSHVGLIFRKHKNKFTFSIISQCWDGSGTWNLSSRAARTCSSFIVNTVADVLTAWAKASAATLYNDTYSPNSPRIFWFQHHKGLGFTICNIIKYDASVLT